jgi:hypothetical protein
MSATFTCEDVLKAYPYPSSIIFNNNANNYCILGALALYLGHPRAKRFPSLPSATHWLKAANPQLKNAGAEYARRITSANDDERDEEAKHLLCEALAFQGLAAIQ